MELRYNDKTVSNARARAKGTHKFTGGTGWDTAMISAFEYTLEEAYAALFIEEPWSER